MYKRKIYCSAFGLLAILFGANVFAQQPIAGNRAGLSSPSLQLEWNKTAGGWRLQQLQIKQAGKWLNLPGVSGEYTVLYSRNQPDSVPIDRLR